jgi:hypothetical protein
MLLRRAVAFALLLAGLSSGQAQQALTSHLPPSPPTAPLAAPVSSAWIDLRQTPLAETRPQSAPDWVQAVTFVPPDPQDASAKSIFRIRLTKPGSEFQVLMFRLFFDDHPKARPVLVVWDESGSQILRSGQLGAGLNLATSDTVLIPMLAVSCIDVEVPGDGSTVRGAFLDWMTSSEMVHPVDAAQSEVIPEPFSAVTRLQTPAVDTEKFGAVTAPLAIEVVPMGASVQEGANFQFGLEAEPLMALLTFEVASPRVDSPPQLYLNGRDIGPATLILPDLADPGYRGEAPSLIRGMHFQYTGWLRAQKMIPLTELKVGTNDLMVISGPGTPVSAIRGTQLQLKYLWDKMDYVLQPQP